MQLKIFILFILLMDLCNEVFRIWQTLLQSTLRMASVYFDSNLADLFMGFQFIMNQHWSCNGQTIISSIKLTKYCIWNLETDLLINLTKAVPVVVYLYITYIEIAPICFRNRKLVASLSQWVTVLIIPDVYIFLMLVIFHIEWVGIHYFNPGKKQLRSKVFFFQLLDC